VVGVLFSRDTISNDRIAGPNHQSPPVRLECVSCASFRDKRTGGAGSARHISEMGVSVKYYRYICPIRADLLHAQGGMTRMGALSAGYTLCRGRSHAHEQAWREGRRPASATRCGPLLAQRFVSLRPPPSETLRGISGQQGVMVDCRKCPYIRITTPVLQSSTSDMRRLTAFRSFRLNLCVLCAQYKHGAAVQHRLLGSIPQDFTTPYRLD
jgi:hypothetical protein